MSLRIAENYVTNLDTFTWGNDWRATKLIKEIRANGKEFYFGQVVRYFGEPEDTQDYDIGDKYEETAWLGRVEKFVGTKKIIDDDQNSPTYGQRTNSKPIVETLEDKDDKGRITKRELLIEGKAVYEYNIPVTEENTEKIKTLVGSIGLSQETGFYFLQGFNAPLFVTPKEFFEITASEYIAKLNEAHLRQVTTTK